MTRSILLKQQVSTSTKRLVVLAEMTDGSVPAEIFKFYRKPLNPLDNSGIRDVFITVCNPVDLQELPIEAPDENSSGYFRTDIIDISYLSATKAEYAWIAIQSAVQDLIDELKANDLLGVENQIYMGDSTETQVRYHDTDAVLYATGIRSLYNLDSILKKTFEPWFGAEAAIGTYTESTLSYSVDNVIKASLTKSFDCRMTLMTQLIRYFGADAIIGQRTKSFGCTAIIKNTIEITHNVSSVLLQQSTKTYSTDAVLA